MHRKLEMLMLKRIKIKMENIENLKRVVSFFSESEAGLLIKAVTCDSNILEELQLLGERPRHLEGSPGSEVP